LVVRTDPTWATALGSSLRVLANRDVSRWPTIFTKSPIHDQADAPTAEEADWAQIVEWYNELVRLTDSPVVRLNRAVAVGQADGPSSPGWAARAAGSESTNSWSTSTSRCPCD